VFAIDAPVSVPGDPTMPFGQVGFGATVTCHQNMKVQAHFWLTDLRIGPDAIGETMDAQIVTANVPKHLQGNAPCHGNVTAPTSAHATLSTQASPSEFVYSNEIAENTSATVSVTC
jgi:hypothetical protein